MLASRNLIMVSMHDRSRAFGPSKISLSTIDVCFWPLHYFFKHGWCAILATQSLFICMVNEIKLHIYKVLKIYEAFFCHKWNLECTNKHKINAHFIKILDALLMRASGHFIIFTSMVSHQKKLRNIYKMLKIYI